jgi:hypothetical protein
MTEDYETHRHRGKMWTYLILAGVVLGVALVFNVAFKNTDRFEHGVHEFLGLPAWVLTVVALVVGVVIFWLGLKVEADWPEYLGATLIAGSIFALEVVIGWHHFELGLFVLPYILPVGVFLVLLAVAMRDSR